MKDPINFHGGFRYYIKTKTIQSSTSKTISLTLKGTQQIIQPLLTLYPYLFMAELYRDRVDNAFGGSTELAFQSNKWIPAGETLDLISWNDELEPLLFEDGVATIPNIGIPLDTGDTYYNRYECLKTYPFTLEDENQLVEIASFMVESRVNMEGRYDKNKNKISNLTDSPLNFNLINLVYSQTDNIFQYRILPEDYYKIIKFPNQIVWSLTKTDNADIDNWTNVNIASSIYTDGDLGAITKLDTFNELLLCFQEKGINLVSADSRVLISSSDGVPIEISNSGKVDGVITLSDTIGCSNKWSIIKAPSGIYFMSNNNKLFKYTDHLENLNDVVGMEKWFSINASKNVWTPYGTNIRSFYNPIYDEVYFNPIDKEYALCYSNKLLAMTSQYSYGGTLAMFAHNNVFYSLKSNAGNVKLWSHFNGEYNNIYNVYRPYDITFISNDVPTMTKIFDTIEFRVDRYDDGVLVGKVYNQKVQEGNPFDYINVSNEYQEANHSFTASSLRKKFRVWRAFIPRLDKSMLRIRNPWAKITLGINNNSTIKNNNKIVLHDLAVKYTV